MSLSTTHEVSLTDAAARLTELIRLAQQGTEVVIVEDGLPVARLMPASPNEEAHHGLEDLLNQLEAEGHLQRAKGKFKSFKPIRTKGKSASRMILEGRE